MSDNPKPIPEQYKDLVETSVYEIARHASKIYPIVTELGGETIVVEGDGFYVKIGRKQ